MKNFLMDALNEISDEHIAEAAAYEKKVKISWRRIIPLAACFILVFAVVFTAVRMKADIPDTGANNTYPSIIVTTANASADIDATAQNVPESTTVMLPPEASIQATEGTNSGTVAVTEGYYNTTQPTTAACTTSLSWDKSPYSYCYRQFSYNGTEYVTYYSALIGEAKLSELLANTVITATDDKGNEQKVTVDIFAIEGVSTDCAVALYFWDGTQKQYCAQGYYVYYNKNYNPETLGKAMKDMNYDDEMLYSVGGIYIHYDAATEDGKVVARKYIINEAATDAFSKLLNNSKNVKTENADFEFTAGSENIVFSAGYLGAKVTFRLNSDGYLSFNMGDKEFCYNIGQQAFYEFMKTVDSSCQVENTTEPVLLMTTSGTTADESKSEINTTTDKTHEAETTVYTAQGSATVEFLPPGLDVKKCLLECETLGEFCECSMYYSPQSTSWVTYCVLGKDTRYSLGYAARKLIDKLIADNLNAKAENRDSTTCEALIFESTFNGTKGIVSTYLCSDGYLYISCNGVGKGFNIGIDAYNEFMSEFKKLTCVWTPEHPVTMG